MVLPFKGAQKHLQKGVCQNWTFTLRRDFKRFFLIRFQQHSCRDICRQYAIL